MIFLAILFGLALGAVSLSDNQEVKLQRGDCPKFWYYFNGTCYKYVGSHMTWADAEFNCVSQKANLVSVHSLEEYEFIQFLIENFDPTQGHTWIGLSDIHKEGRWMWSDGSAVDFAIWSPGQPDNYTDGEHCVHTNFGEQKWNDIKCYDSYSSVCAYRIACPCS
uniref:C-type lectin domain-containing protein n=1 Tax=Amphilophus citrinellus TaxID=61819 RepID=A0A3Q0SMK6_AMPCI